MTPLLTVQIRTKRFAQTDTWAGDAAPARDVLRDLVLSLRRGERIALVGASGCGKSTLLRLIAGLDAEFDGQVRLDGQLIGGPRRDIRFVFQEPRLFPWLSVARNVAFDLGDAVDAAARERVDALLDEVGLAGLGERLPKQLSGGQAQRVAIARGLFVQPRVLLLDEPFSAVDAFTRLKLQDLLLRVTQAHGIALLLVTHDIDEAVQIADRVLVLEADPGRIAAEIEIDLPRPRDRDEPARAAAIARKVAEVRQALHRAHAI